jgi:hypothetical protein
LLVCVFNDIRVRGDCSLLLILLELLIITV